jgi:hypothetical protein
VEAGNIKKMEAGEAGADEYVFLFDAPFRLVQILA